MNTKPTEEECFFDAQLKEIELKRKVLEEKQSEYKYESSTFKCFTCGSKHIEWTTKQTRSMDEASTVYYTCTTCGQNWKQR
jgi:DNA-directed RNA polymerase subunit M/transcription elongation factor TFIIS